LKGKRHELETSILEHRRERLMQTQNASDLMVVSQRRDYTTLRSWRSCGNRAGGRRVWGMQKKAKWGPVSALKKRRGKAGTEFH